MERAIHPFDAELDTTDGWAKYNSHYWQQDYRDFAEFFFAQMFNEPHSTKQIEDCVEWSQEIPPSVLIDATRGQQACQLESFRSVCERVTAPVLVIHGDDDRIRPYSSGVALAELTGGQLVTIGGGGHGPQARDPIVVNRLIERFVDTVRPRPRQAPPPRTWVRAARRPKRALYISSPIGLGHALRDATIADELRKLHPDLQIDWLAQHPVTKVLEERGERIHPASAFLASESAHVEEEAGEHDLHAFQAIREMDEVLVNNFMVFDDLVRDEHYDVVIGDEAWDIDYFLHENPERKHFEFAWMTDFVGWLPMPDGGAREAEIAADYNAEMIEQRARYRRLRDRSIFIGDPDDIVPDAFGEHLPGIRDWTEANFEFSGYVTGFDPADFVDRDSVARRTRVPRRRAGVRGDRRRVRCRRRPRPASGRSGARRPRARSRRSGSSSSSGRASTRARSRGATAWSTSATSPTSTVTSRRVIWRSCRAGSRRAWNSPPTGGRSSTCRCSTTSSRTSTSTTACSGTAPAGGSTITMRPIPTISPP